MGKQYEWPEFGHKNVFVVQINVESCTGGLNVLTVIITVQRGSFIGGTPFLILILLFEVEFNPMEVTGFDANIPPFSGKEAKGDAKKHQIQVLGLVNSVKSTFK
ncbi:MAG: hypothetical protein AAF551_04470 [Bacteroidota bacterium]